MYYKEIPGERRGKLGADYKVYNVNSLGFRGKEFHPYSSDGKIRIFAVGDSTSFGLGSTDDQTWPTKLEYYLNKDTGKRFSVINSGFGGGMIV